MREIGKNKKLVAANGLPCPTNTALPIADIISATANVFSYNRKDVIGPSSPPVSGRSRTRGTYDPCPTDNPP